jgi:hypothetical protein
VKLPRKGVSSNNDGSHCHDQVPEGLAGMTKRTFKNQKNVYIYDRIPINTKNGGPIRI